MAWQTEKTLVFHGTKATLFRGKSITYVVVAHLAHLASWRSSSVTMRGYKEHLKRSWACQTKSRLTHSSLPPGRNVKRHLHVCVTVESIRMLATVTKARFVGGAERKTTSMVRQLHDAYAAGNAVVVSTLNAAR